MRLFATLLIIGIFACTKEEFAYENPTIVVTDSLTTTIQDTVIVDSVQRVPLITTIQTEDSVTLYYASSHHNLWKKRIKGEMTIVDSVRQGSNVYVILKNKKGKKASLTINNYSKTDSTTCSGQDTLIVGFYQVK